MIAITLEMASIPSLAFAVGVYLPLASSAPLFVGGLIRWLVDRRQRAQFKDTALTEAQLAAESDKSPGVLLSSGYIAGGAITGIIVAFMEECFPHGPRRLMNGRRATIHFIPQPIGTGLRADWLTLIPFIFLCFYLYRVGRNSGAAERK